MSKHKTSKEMFPLIAEWESASQTRIEFCETHRLSLSTFAYWRKRYLEHRTSSDTGFKELHPQVSSQIEIHYPNGVRVSLPANGPMATVQALIHLF